MIVVKILMTLTAVLSALAARAAAEPHVAEVVADVSACVAVAAFGNSFRTDGEFLRYVVSQPLPGGAKPVAMMINGGAEPERYKGLFRCVEQVRTVGHADVRNRTPSR